MIFEAQRFEFRPDWLVLSMLPYALLRDIYEGKFNELPDGPGLYFVLCKNKYSRLRGIHTVSGFNNDGSPYEERGYKILYIGKALSIRRRWQEHHRLPQILVHSCENESFYYEYSINDARIAFVDYSYEFRKIQKGCTNDLLLQMEKECIEHFKPLLNGTPVYNGELTNEEIVDLYSIPLEEEYSA